MNNINTNNYIPGNTYVAPADGQGVENKEGLTGLGTTHEPGQNKLPTTPPRQALPELIGPRQGLDSSLLSKGGSELDNVLSIMSLLFEMARKAREMGLLQRDMENQAVISAQKDQVSEMRHGANLMIAMAVVSGVMTVTSAIMGAISLSKSFKAIKQDKAINADMLTKQEQFKQLRAAGKEMGSAGQDLMTGIENNKSALETLSKKFETNNARQQLAGTVLQGAAQVGNSTTQVYQGYSQADAKEDEVRSSIAQTQKQKVEDLMNFNNNFMKDVLQMMQQYAQSHNQAMRAAFGVA